MPKALNTLLRDGLLVGDSEETCRSLRGFRSAEIKKVI